MHKFIFEKDEDRKNRQRLRDFQGFTFEEDSSEYIGKVEYARRLTIGDLISCCNILGLEYDGSKEEVITRLCKGLMDLNSLIPKDVEEEKQNETEEEKDRDDNAIADRQSEKRKSCTRTWINTSEILHDLQRRRGLDQTF